LSIAIFTHGFTNLLHLFGIQPAMIKSNFFQAGNFVALAMLDGLHEGTGRLQAVVGAGIQLGKSATQQLDIQVPAFQVSLIDSG